ncbi:MAG: LPS assembly lipoprotein LptE, partial [Tepidisphaeraceae bacterium]
SYQWRSLYREDVKTVAVPIFQNKAFRRGVEFQLSRAVVQQIEAKSPYKVVPKDRADTILEGEITSLRLQDVSDDAQLAIPQEQLYVVTVDFVWKDLRTGRILVERRNFQQTATFYPTLGEGEFVGSQQSVEQLALAIVQEMQADW